MEPNKDGYYRTEITVFDSKGNKRKIAVRAKSEKEFHEKIIRTKIEIERGEITFNGNTKFNRWADEWLETYKQGAICDKNYQTYEANLKNHINPIIGELSLKDIKKIHCQKVVNSQSGKSKSHISKIRMTLYQIFDEAVENEYINRNPARKLTLPACSSGTHRSITPFEREHILKVAEWHHAGLWILTMLYCGLRPSETKNLMWCDIDFGNEVIKIRKSKTDAGVRSVPMPKELVERFMAEKENAKATFVFHQKLNPLKQMTEDSLRCFWNNFKRELDISMGAKVYRNQIVLSVVANDLTPYCLRHTCATDYELAGVPINIAKVLLGHSDISTTGNVYTHYTSETEKEVKELINKKANKNYINEEKTESAF